MNKELYPVKFRPIPMERIWGGSKLKSLFNTKTKSPIGEYWVLSAHPNGMSQVVNGTLAGKTLVELTKEYPKEFLGESPQEGFPLLIKFIEAEQDLSVQVHPNDEFALKEEGDYGKTEAWYIIDHKEKAQIIYGHSFKDKEHFRKALADKKVKDFLNYRTIEKGELIFVPSQTLHAILSGTTLIEIQQSSDVTYRVYDWDRVDEKGQGRELHVDKAQDVIDFNNVRTNKKDKRKTIISDNRINLDRLVSCPYFTIDELNIHSDVEIEQGHNGNPDILVIAEGEGRLITFEDSAKELSLKQGDTVLIPSNIAKYKIETSKGIKCLRTFY